MSPPTIGEPILQRHRHASALIGHPREDAFDAVTRLVGHTFGVPCALMTLVDGDRQWFMSSYGLGEPWASHRETPLTHSFCQYVVAYDAPVVISDAREHALVRDNLAIPDLNVIAYLGVPLRDAAGVTIGSLAAIHHQPRRWASAEVELLAEFATVAMSEVNFRAETARRERTAATHAALLRQMPAAVLAAEPGTGHALYWNASAEALWGASLAVGRVALVRVRVRDADGRPLSRDELPLARVAAGAEEARLEYVVARTDGGDRWVRDHAFVVRDADGTVTQCVSLVEDVTEQRRDHEALRQAQRLESVGLLAGGVAHDFNNLLTVVLSNCDLALAALSPEHAAYEEVAEVRAAGERAASLTRQLLAFSRNQVLRRAPLDLNDVVRGAHRLLDRLLGELVALRLELAPTLPAVLADRGQLEQVLMNLVVNARDAMPGGGAVTVGTERVALRAGEVAGLEAGEYVALTVRDGGTGMDAATAARVFEPFFTTKHVGAGTGLGLATVYGIARQLHGAVTVTSAPGDGALFRVLLPACG